jgi:hypothetical protein
MDVSGKCQIEMIRPEGSHHAKREEQNELVEE